MLADAGGLCWCRRSEFALSRLMAGTSLVAVHLLDRRYCGNPRVHRAIPKKQRVRVSRKRVVSTWMLKSSLLPGLKHSL